MKSISYLLVFICVFCSCSNSFNSSLSDYDEELAIYELLNGSPYIYTYESDNADYEKYDYKFTFNSSNIGVINRTIVIKKDGRKGKGVIESSFKWNILTVSNNTKMIVRLSFMDGESWDITMLKNGKEKDDWNIEINVKDDPISFERNFSYNDFFFCNDNKWNFINYYKTKDFNTNGQPVYTIYDNIGLETLKIIQNFWVKFNDDGSFLGEVCDKQNISGIWFADEDGNTINISLKSDIDVLNQYNKEFFDVLNEVKYYKGDSNTLYLFSLEKDLFIMFRPNQ